MFVLLIAPPSHLALNQKQLGPTECGGEEFCTVPRDVAEGGYGQLSFGSKGRNDGAEEFPQGWAYALRNVQGWSQGVYGVPALHRQIEEYLTDGFYDLDPYRPARNIVWAYGASILRAIGIFSDYFGPEGWTNGTIFAGGFSLGGFSGAIANEADPESRLTGIFTYAAHASLDDNFRVPGNNLGNTIITSRRDLSPFAQPLSPFVAWDCEDPWYQSFSALAPLIVDQMDAGCELSRFFSPLHYDPTFDPNRKVLLAQGAQDEPWSVKGFEETYKYYSGYVYLGNAQMELEGDVDHAYFLGGVTGSYGGELITPSEKITWGSYPEFEDSPDDVFETFVNADWLNPDHSDSVDTQFWQDPSPSLGFNRLHRTIRNFVLYHGGYDDSGIVLAIPPPPPPGKADGLGNGVDVELSVFEDGDDTIVRYEMTSCFDETLLNEYEELEIVFRASADKFWHVLPACDEESDEGIGEGTYTVNVDNAAYDYNADCYRMLAAPGEKFGKCTSASGDMDTDTTHDGFRGVATAGPEGEECRTYAVEFRGTTSGFQSGAWEVPDQFTAWAELRAYDANDRFLTGSTSYIEPVSQSPLPDQQGRYTQCVRPIKHINVYRLLRQLVIDDEVSEITAEFPDAPTCTPLELDEWPIAVEGLYALDLRGYDVTIPAYTTLETGPAGLVIGTDCDLTIEEDATLTIDHGDDDVDSRILLIARNIQIDGSVVNDSEERGAVRGAALDSIAIGATGVLSATNLLRDGEDGEGLVGLHTLGAVTLAGQLDANETQHGGIVTIAGDDVTIAATAILTADADDQETGSVGGVIGVKADGDLIV